MSFPGFPGPPGTGSPPPPLNHNLLSTTHSDTTSAAPLIGDVITSPAGGTWERLSVGVELDHLVIVGGIPTWSAQAGSGLGDVTGPSSSNDSYIALFDGTSGKMIQQGLLTVDNAGNMAVEGNSLVSGDLSVLGDIFSSGNLNLPGTLGDILYATTLNTFGNLGIGADNEVLTVAGGVPTWAASAGGGGASGVFTGDLTVGGDVLISGDLTVLGLTIVTVSSGTATSYTIGDTYFNAITSATTGVLLPPTPITGQQHVIKDADGTAGTIPITVSGNGNTIDGLTSTSLLNNYEAKKLIFGPTEWNII